MRFPENHREQILCSPRFVHRKNASSIDDNDRGVHFYVYERTLSASSRVLQWFFRNDRRMLESKSTRDRL